MKKILNLVLLPLAVLFIVVNVFGAKLLAGVIGQQIGAPVSISRLNVGLSGLGIYGFKIGNPEGFGFQEKNVAEVPEISVKYELASFFKGKPHISLIVLNFGDVTVEKAAGNKVNLLEVGAVKGMMKGQQGQTTEPSQTEPSKPSKPVKPMAIQIDEVRVNIGKARYVDSAVQPATVKELDLGIRDEVFKNVTNPADLTKDIIFLIMRKVGLSTLPGNLDVLAQGIGGGVQSAIGGLKDKFKI
ncbi:MAG: hypothetical protein KBC91_06120 [Candidatus Omnitrophica bacterium]|nr:hypothetical protein [Candidatus Omnitrophota bacterium]